MERQTFRTFACTAGLLAVCSAFGGEKIQFSAPSKDSQLPSEERTFSKPAPNLFDKFRNGGADALNMAPPTLPQERPSARSTNDKKDWILGMPDGKRDDSEDLFRSKGDEKETQPRGLGRYVEALEQARGSEQENRPGERSAQFGATGRFSEYTLDEESRALESTVKGTFDASKYETENFNFKEYWRDTTGLNMNRFDEQSATRRAEFQQIFERRSVALPQIANAPTANEAANALAPRSTDFKSNTSQSSVAESYQNGYAPLNGGRSDLFGNVNQRALGRESSSPLNTRTEHPKIQAQPAVLPFPSRPGELFKRPGSF